LQQEPTTYKDAQCQVTPDTCSKYTETFHNPTREFGVETDPPEPSNFADRVLQSEVKCKAVCGVSRSFFKTTVTDVNDAFKLSSALSPRDQVVLYFMKLKTNLTYVAIGVIFDISPPTVSKIFTNILDAHYAVACQLMWWHSRAEVQATMPESFKLHYPNTRAIIDATEVNIQSPSRVDSRILTFSYYKAHFTMKALLAITPSGSVSFISKAYGGRVTDSHLTNHSGFLQLIEPGDVIMADKGSEVTIDHINDSISLFGIFDITISLFWAVIFSDSISK
jgi:hypothetical protein